MTPRLRLVVGTLVLFCAVAIGAPDGPEGPAEKSAYPLFEEDGQWWAGIGDVCEIVGAEFEGGGFTQAIEQEDGKLRIQMRVVFGHAGPLKITVGEDTYEIEVGREQIDKNGENYRDFIHTPKRVKGVACATLEDLSGLLGFVVGEPDDGQPTIVADEGPIRLVEGERPIPMILGDGDQVRIFRDWAPDPKEPEDFHWFHGRTQIRAGGPGGYVEFGGKTYYQAPGNPFNRSGAPRYYGPVQRGAANVNGKSADLMQLSIVEFERPPVGVVTVPGPFGRLRIDDLPELEGFIKPEE